MGKGQFSPVEKKPERNGLVDKKGKQENGVVQKEDTMSDNYVTPPDGGWGWMVVFSSFLIHVIADGIVYSFGVFLMEFVDYFQSGRGAASWVGSLQPAVTFTVGPLSSALTNLYGCRNVTIAGAVIAAIGFIISVWAPNLYYLYFTSGIMAGIGFGLIYLPAIVCVAQYFEKRRSFATGLAVCGSGFGTFILAPITEKLVHEYSWRGAMLILGGIIFNVVVCGFIFRPLEPDASKVPPTTSEETSKLLGKTELDGAVSQTPKDHKKTLNIEEVELMINKNLGGRKGDGEGGEGEGILTAEQGLEIINSLQEIHVLPNGKAMFLNDMNVSHGSDNQPPVATESTETTHEAPTISSEVPLISTYDDIKGYSSDSERSNIQISQCLSVPPSKCLADIARSDGALHISHSSPRGNSEHTGVRPRQQRQLSFSESTSHTSSITQAPLHRKDIFYSGSLLNIPMYKSQPDVYHATVAASNHDVRSNSEKGKKKRSAWSEMMTETMKDMLSVTLLKNPVFLMFAISNFFTSIGFNMPFIFLPDRAKLSGIDEDRAALLLSVIGIANTAGRIVFGYLADRECINRLMLYNTALTICGVATALSPLVGGDYGLLVAYAAIFGIFIGVYVSLTSVVLVDLLGLEYLTNSFGLLLLFQGAATFVGPPIAGWLCDWTGSYDISFILMGTLIALSGCMLYFLPLVERCYARRVPRLHIMHDMELGKHPVRNDDAEIISEEQISAHA